MIKKIINKNIIIGFITNLLLFSCIYSYAIINNTCQTTVSANKLVKWQNKQIKSFKKIIYNKKEYLIGLGFGNHNYNDTALLIAKLNALSDLSESNKIFITTFVRVINNESFNKKTKDSLINKIYTSSQIQIKKIKFKTLSTKKINNKYHYAVIAYSPKKDMKNYFPVSYSKNYELFIKKINKLFLEKYIDKNKVNLKN